MTAVADEVLDLLVDCRNPLLALSGGADSLLIFIVLLHRKSIENTSFQVVFFNYDTWEEDKWEKQIVVDLCEEFSIECIVRNIPIAYKTSTKAVKRPMIYDMLYEIALTRHFDSIITGHNKDDLLDSFIMRLVRSTGFWGTSSIKKIFYYNGVKIVRPLLNIPRNKIEQVMDCVAYIIDRDNKLSVYMRNKIRQMRKNSSIDFMAMVPTIHKLTNFQNDLYDDAIRFLCLFGKLYQCNVILIEYQKFLETTTVNQNIIIGLAIGYLGKKSFMETEKIHRVLKFLSKKKQSNLHNTLIVVKKKYILISRENFALPTAHTILDHYYVWDKRFIIKNAKGNIITPNTVMCTDLCKEYKTHNICVSLPMVVSQEGVILAAGYSNSGIEIELIDSSLYELGRHI